MYADILEADASDMIWSLMGTAMHTVLERGGIGTKGMVEERLYADVDGAIISGQFDYRDADDIIWDWKIASVWEVMNGVKQSREQQLNAYAYLATTNLLPVRGLRIGFILRDWSQTEAYRRSDYPPHQVVVYGIPLWSKESAESYLRERVRLHREAALALPECSKEERWAKDDTYAVLKGNAKRASRVFGSRHAATEYLGTKDGTYRMDIRPGESVRCQSYCPVSLYCSQWEQLRR